MKNIHSLFLVSFLFCGSLVFSQTQESVGLPNDLDGKYTPDKTSLFNSSTDAYNTGSRNSDEVRIKNVISFDISNLVRSSATVYYERALHKILSVQVGIGSLFAKDQVQQTFIPVGLAVFSEQNGNNTYTNSSATSLTDILKNSSYRSPGIFLAGGIKLYVSGTAPKGIYFQVGTTYAVSNLLFNSANFTGYNGITVQGSPNISVRNLNFNFTWGYQFVFGVGKVKFVNTVYAGVGLKRITYTGVAEYNGVYNYSTGITSPSYYQIGSDQSVIVPSMILGFSLGVGL